MNGRRYHKRKRKKIIVAVCFLLFTVFIGIAIKKEDVVPADIQNNNHDIENELDSNYTHEVGTTESYYSYGSTIKYSIHYPNINAVTNLSIEEFVTSAVLASTKDYTDYKSSDSMLHTNYNSYALGEEMVSICLYIDYNNNSLAHPETTIQTKIFNMNTGKEVTAEELFTSDYTTILSEYCKEYFERNPKYKDDISDVTFTEGIEPIEDNFSRFVLTSTEMTVIFPRYQIFSGDMGDVQVSIPYDRIEEMIKFDPSTGSLKDTEADLDVSEQGGTDTTVTLDPSKPMVALTFDDGPHPTYTNQILDTLKKYNSHATFYTVGSRISSYSDTAKRILLEGSELGTHTFSHKLLTMLPDSEISNEIEQSNKELEKYTGSTATSLRPPYGGVNDAVKKNANLPIINWSIDSLDWKKRDANTIVNEVLKNISDGDIILMHDLYETSAEAVDILVPKLAAQGYQIVSVLELLRAKEIPVSNGQIYYSGK